MNSALLWVFTLSSLASFFGVVFGADPYSGGSFIRIIFFLALLFSLTGTFSLAGILILKLRKKPFVFEAIFRRSFLLAALGTSVTGLETFSILNIWNSFAVFLLVVSLEMLATHKR